MLHSPQNVIKHMPVVVTTQLSSNSIGVSIAGQTGRVSSLRVSRAQPKREKERGGQAETPLIGRRWCCQSVPPLGAEPLSSVGALWVGVQCPGQGRPEALGVPASWHGLLARPSGHQPSRLPGAPLWGLPVHGLCRPSAARPPACLLACLPATAATVPLGVPATTATPQSACWGLARLSRAGRSWAALWAQGPQSSDGLPGRLSLERACPLPENEAPPLRSSSPVTTGRVPHPLVKALHLLGLAV